MVDNPDLSVLDSGLLDTSNLAAAASRTFRLGSICSFSAFTSEGRTRGAGEIKLPRQSFAVLNANSRALKFPDPIREINFLHHPSREIHTWAPTRRNAFQHTKRVTLHCK